MHFRLPALLLCCFGLTACAGEPTPAHYGEKVHYRTGTPIHFPDFTLTYIGKRHVSGPAYPRGWDVFDFRIETTDHTQTISWTAGTGLIDATDFTVTGKHFTLERLRATKLGPLREDELVITATK